MWKTLFISWGKIKLNIAHDVIELWRKFILKRIFGRKSEAGRRKLKARSCITEAVWFWQITENWRIGNIDYWEIIVITSMGAEDK
ncbi:hypothetical protein ACQ7CU_01345 [Chryseobacterium arthrosphaerae]|uniref:hypothetical protein n=1 Tax=Chryseobacterium arthrosphaerae TaxID=651561 RepID=UPI003D353359